jgi:hypothetical protein
MAVDEDILSRLYRANADVRVTYESLYQQLLERRQTDAEFSIQDLRGFLKDAYVYQDYDWIGRGVLFDAANADVRKQAATIAAYEAVLAEWQAELEEAAPGQSCPDVS